MNEQLKQVQAFWLQVAAYYKYTLAREQAKMFIAQTKQFSTEELLEAFNKYCESPRGDRMPYPKNIKEYLRSDISPLSKANEISGRIFQAISTYGYTNLEAAKEFVGGIGWAIVERDGGWSNVCQNSDIKNKGTQKAQWREMALSLIEQDAKGNLMPALEFKKPVGETQRIRFEELV